MYLKKKILIFHIHFVFAHRVEWGRFAWFPSVFFAETVHFLGDFFAEKFSEIFVFCAVVVTIFCILSVYLFIIIIILVGVN